MPIAVIIIIDAVCKCLSSGFGSLGSAAFKVFGGMIIVAFVGLLACHKEIILEYKEKRKPSASVKLNSSET
jgi:hypothetical protein